MPVQDYQTNPNSNTTVGGTFIGEGAPPGNINNAMRQIMADIRVFHNGIPVASGLAPLNAPVFTGQPTFQGRGAFLHHNNPANAAGRVFVVAVGQSVSGLVNGDIVLEVE